ncbi:MAG TPA: LON peptidase substrate-binding domain-containing protein [Steroidobacteraceae bacterium]|nr:LON peptidase substrate-binding domain-containing protein [Steroidobacteraceae bacterium]HRX88658.1 LON peptidase substrate-binding domain-containing protein [Steroidobacteraceae bacterium]
MTDTAQIPLFPLNVVLFPGGPLPLRIFETRYTDMVRHCMREQSAFGVVLIRSGGEAGAVAKTAEIGTTARIVDFSQLPDNLLGITCVGERKFRVLTRWRESDGLNKAQVQWLAPEPAIALPPDTRHLSAILRKVLPELDEVYQHVEKHFEDSAWVGARITELIPLELNDKQALLELNDPLERLQRLAPMIKRPDELV